MIFPLLMFILLSVSYIWGKTSETRHFSSLARREEETKHHPFLAEQLKYFYKPVRFIGIASSSVVMGGGLFRHFWAYLRNIVGGHVAAYESLQERARREAILRIKEAHPHADYFLNAKIETINVRWTMVEVIVWATVIYLEPENADTL